MQAACGFLSVKAGVRRFIDSFALDQLDQRPQRAVRRRRNPERLAAPSDQALNLACPWALAARQILRGRREQRLEAKRMTTQRFVGQENVSALISKRSLLDKLQH